MKTRKTITALFILSAMVLGGTKMGHAAEDTNRINARARANTLIKIQDQESGIADLCQQILASVPSENGGTDCEEKRNQCETQIREAFESDVPRRIENCEPSHLPDECFITLGLNIDHCTDAGNTPEECAEQCNDNSTPTSRCLDDLITSHRGRLTVAAQKYKLQLQRVCQPEAQPADPVVDNPVNAGQDQNPNQNSNQGVDNPPAPQVVTGNGVQNTGGGCSMNGMSGGAGNLATFILGFLPLAVAWSRKRK